MEQNHAWKGLRFITSEDLREASVHQFQTEGLNMHDGLSFGVYNILYDRREQEDKITGAMEFHVT